MVLGLNTGVAAVCSTSRCVAGISIPLWRLVDASGKDCNPAGPHRPVPRDADSVITPVSSDSTGELRPHWLMIH